MSDETTGLSQTDSDFIASVEAKAAELSTQLDNIVTPIIITAPDGTKAVGYFQEPQYDVLMYAVDCYLQQTISKATEAVVKDCLIVSESDPRILSDKRKDAKLKAGFVNAATKFIIPLADEYKKK